MAKQRIYIWRLVVKKLAGVLKVMNLKKENYQVQFGAFNFLTIKIMISMVPSVQFHSWMRGTIKSNLSWWLLIIPKASRALTIQSNLATSLLDLRFLFIQIRLWKPLRLKSGSLRYTKLCNKRCKVIWQADYCQNIQLANDSKFQKA